MLGGVLVAVAGVDAGFAAAGLAFALSVFALRGLPRDAPPAHREARAGERLSREVLAGFAAVLAEPRMRLVLAALAVATLVQGAIDVLIVVVALDVLDAGEAGLGWLNAAWGVGGITGGAAAVALLGGGRLAYGIGIGCLLAGAALAGVATWQAIAPALALLVVVGGGYALIEVAGLTLTQRLASVRRARPRARRGTGAPTSSRWRSGRRSRALPSACSGSKGRCSPCGAATALLALATWRPLGRLEASVPIPEREFGLLRGLGIFAPLPIATIETLAARLEQVTVDAGNVVVREGEEGDRCYVVAEGEIALSKQIRLEEGAMRPGGFFGELALLRDAPRNATAVAAGPGLLLALERSEFLAAVTAHARTQEAADALVLERVGAA